MENLLIAMALLISVSSFADSFCKRESIRNKKTRQEILNMKDTSKATKSILLQMNANAKRSVELTIDAICN